jgi:Gram-negative bacterial TonB protein C-terminal
MAKAVFLRTIGLLIIFETSLALGASHPATVGQGADSVAKQLHYPPKERAAKAQGAVKFYCEVSPAGKLEHISTLYNKGEGHFGNAVEFALRHGRFIPATLNGKPISVMLGGTVLFMLADGQPTIALSLVTAESDRIASMSNYVQPQMIDTDALFRRKIYSRRDKYHLQSGAHPGATVTVRVDAQGRIVTKKIDSETPSNGGRGRLLLDVMNEESFIPAQSNGQPVAGDFQLAVDFEYMRNPDGGPETGTLLKNGEE